MSNSVPDNWRPKSLYPPPKPSFSTLVNVSFSKHFIILKNFWLKRRKSARIEEYLAGNQKNVTSDKAYNGKDMYMFR